MITTLTNRADDSTHPQIARINKRHHRIERANAVFMAWLTLGAYGHRSLLKRCLKRCFLLASEKAARATGSARSVLCTDWEAIWVIGTAMPTSAWFTWADAYGFVVYRTITVCAAGLAFGANWECGFVG